jgi:hypothetical protein
VKVSSKPRGLFLLEPFSHLPTTSYVIGAKSVNIVENGTSCVRQFYVYKHFCNILILTNPLQTHCDSFLEMQEIFPFD